MKPTLLVLAAGMGSRYGSLKQIDGVGPKGETIIDYSVYDAIRAGFGKVVFVIRESFAADFKEKVTAKFADKIEIAFAYQAVDTPVEGVEDLPERTKPWGTAHAVLVAEHLINEPFAVVNADDYYGIDSFNSISKFLTEKVTTKDYCMVGFILEKTLSDNGSVSRGVCQMNEKQVLETVVERTKVQRIDGTVYFEENEERVALSDKSLVSMNLWGFHPNIFKIIREDFIAFVKENFDSPKAEFYIPLVVNRLVDANAIDCHVLTSYEKWYGVTYKEDKEGVQDALLTLTESGKYPNPLWQ